jgi:hypothetical protein
MLETLLKFGSHRVDYFDRSGHNPQAFAFYVRGTIEVDERFSYEAKCQLYTGLAWIKQQLGLQNLAAVYIDINKLDNLQRSAYVQLKKDLRSGIFSRVFVVNQSAVMGTPAANADLAAMRNQIHGFELLSRDEMGISFAQAGLQQAELMSV